MPIPKDASVDEVFHEFRHGKTYARTRKKFGKKKARKQMIAVALGHERARKKRKSSRKKHHKHHKKGAKR